MWAHGYRGEGTVLTVDPPGFGLRQHLLELGYAWAASSYDANGYDIESGVRSTRDLARHFRRLVERPSRIYIGGVSMGGHVTARSIEQYPALYDGALPLCGVVGDVELFDFFLDFTLVAQALADVDGYPIPANYLTNVVPRDPGDARHGRHRARPPDQRARAAVPRRSSSSSPVGRGRGRRSPSASGRTSCSACRRPTTAARCRFNAGRVGTNVDTDYEPDDPVAIDEIVRRVATGGCRRSTLPALGPIALVDGKPHVPVLLVARPRRPVRAVLDGAVLRRRCRRQWPQRPARAAGDPGRRPLRVLAAPR